MTVRQVLSSLARTDFFCLFSSVCLQFMKDLKFGIGDGHLQYYLYNWKVAKALLPSQVGLVLL